MRNSFPFGPWRRTARLPALLMVLACCLHAANAEDATVPCYRMRRQVSCVAVPLASAAEDIEAKRFRPQDDRARLYLLRPGTMAPMTKSTILLDGKPVRELAPMTYAVLEASPGLHRLTARADHDVELEVSLEPGKIQYVENRYSLLFFTTSAQLLTMDERKAQAAISQLKLVKSGGENQ